MQTRAIVIALGLSLFVATAMAHQPRPKTAAEATDVLNWNRDTIGGPFTLVDEKGRKRTEADFRGKLMVVYFGYMQCQDVCPMDLQQIGMAIESLGAAGDAVQPLFITLDPERDTAKRLAAYVPAFHPRLVGLRGSPAAVEKAAHAYRVYYKKLPIGKGGSYDVGHSGAIYLMDREGKYLTYFAPGTSAQSMAEKIRPYLVTQ